MPISLSEIQECESWLSVSPSHPDRREKLSKAGCGYASLVSDTSPPSYIEKAIQCLWEVVMTTPQGHPDRAGDLFALGSAHRRRHWLVMRVDEIEVAVELLQDAVDLTPENDASRASRVASLAEANMRKHRHTGHLADIEACIYYFEQSAAFTPPSSFIHGDLQIDLADAYISKYRKTDTILDLKGAIKWYTGGLGIIPHNRERVEKLSLLATCHMRMFKRTKAVPHAARATEVCREALSLLHSQEFANCVEQEGEADKTAQHILQEEPTAESKLLRLMSTVQLDMYRETLDRMDLEAAIQSLKSAVATLPLGSDEWAGALLDLSSAWSFQYDVTKSREDLETAIRCSAELCGAMTKAFKNRQAALKNAGVLYRSMYGLTGSLEDLLAAVRVFQQAADETTKQHAYDSGVLVSLTDLFFKLAPLTRATHVGAAIKATQEYLKLLPHTHVNYLPCLDSLTKLSQHGIQYGGKTEWLQAAVESSKKALALTASNDSGRVQRLIRLGSVYEELSYRNEVEGVTEVEDAIAALEEARHLVDDNDAPCADVWYYLGRMHARRYLMRGAAEDVATATHFFEKARAVSKTGPERTLYTHALGTAYQTRFTRTGNVEDLDLSLRYLEAVLDETQKDDLNLATRLKDLGRAYLLKYETNKNDQANLRKAIDKLHASLDCSIGHHREKAYILNHLGQSYDELYQKRGVIDDLERSIKYHQEAFDSLSKNDHFRSFQASQLLKHYVQKGKVTNAQQDKEKAILYARESMDSARQSPRFRRMASCQLIHLHASQGSWDRGYKVAKDLSKYMTYFISYGLQTSDKQHLLSDMVGMASDIAAVTLMAGKSPYEALELLELERGVILGTLLDLRADISHVKQRFPEMAKEFEATYDELVSTAWSEQVLDMDMAVTDQPGRVDKRWAAGSKFQRIIMAIRTLPGHERFLLPPSESELQAAAAALSPIVVVNVSTYRCDALIIQQDGLRTIRLPKLTVQSIGAYQYSLSSPDLVKTEMLEWLWDTTAQPVLEALGLSHSPTGEQWPRVQWILTGRFAKFPIHAAGYHDREQCSVIERVVSSYSVSLRSLVVGLQERSKVRREKEAMRDIVVVHGQSSDLQFATREIEEVACLWKDKGNVSQPTVASDKILEALQSCDIFHFAGHGRTDRSDPLKSALILGKKDALKVSSLLDLDLGRRKPFLAYLSACGTGRIRHETLTDEGVHLTAAFQLAGFRHVIGTLWSVEDQSCLKAAYMFYEWVQAHGASEDSVAEGLHSGVSKLRQQWLLDSGLRDATEQGDEEHGASFSPDNGTRSQMQQLPVATFEQTGSGSGAKNTDVSPGQLAIRPVEAVDEEAPLSWVPYVHFGI